MLGTNLLLSFLVACKDDDDDGGLLTVVTDPEEEFGPKIGTTPNFYGKVPKNLLWVSIDTFRRDHLGRWGNQDLTDFMDDMVDHAFVADAHHTCSNWTYAGTTCNLLGRTHEEDGFQPKLSGTYKEPMPEGTKMLPDWLRPAGFHSIVVSSNSWYSPEWKSTQGFDEEYLPSNGAAMAVANEGISRLQTALDSGVASERWFLHLHIKEPHAPYNPPESYLDGIEELPAIEWDLSNKDEQYALLAEYPTMTAAEQDALQQHLEFRYAAEVAYTDDLVADMWKEFQKADMLEDTLVVFWNDHGEQMWEHANQGHAYKLNGEENLGFLWFWAQNVVADVWTEPTSSIDVAPTLLNLYGIDIPLEVTGLPIGQAEPDRAIFASTDSRLVPRHMVRKGDYRMEFSYDGQLWMYDLASDPGETDDVFDVADPLAQELWDALEPQVLLGQPLMSEHDLTLPAIANN